MHVYSAVLLLFLCDAATCIVPIAIAVLAFLTAIFNGITSIVIKRLELEKKGSSDLDSNHAKHKEHKRTDDKSNSKTRHHTAN